MIDRPSREALIRKADAKRLAQVAKDERIAIAVRIGGREVVFFPDSHSGEAVASAEEVVL